MFQDLKSSKIRKIHKSCLNDPSAFQKYYKDLSEAFAAVLSNHHYNTMLWQEEDLARRTNVKDFLIANNKRAIDRYNQKRNDAVEEIDNIVLSQIPHDHFVAKDAWINSETVGSIIDRMSINSLKCFHMAKQTERKDVDKEHIALCREKLNQLIKQGDYLAECLDTLLINIAEGKATYKIYRQFKMYNDPKLNPYIAKANILIIKHGSLGDFILATGAFKAIRERFPAHNLILLTSQPYLELAEKTGFFNEIWIDNRKPWYNIWYNLRVIKRLRSCDYDFVFDLQCSPRTNNYFKLMEGHKYNWSGKAKGCSHYFDAEKKLNKIIYFQQQLEKANISILPVPNIEWLKSDVSGIVPKKDFVVFIPGCSKKHQEVKAWTAGGYAAIVDWLAKRGVASVLTGTEVDRRIIEEIIQKSHRKEHILNLLNQANFGQMAELARQAKFVIGADTGPMHIAAATGCASVILFSTRTHHQPEATKPWGGNVVPVITDTLADLPAASVIKKLDHLLSEME